MSENSTIDLVKCVIRECLKLEPTTEIPDDMEFRGGQHDVDSLDVLLIVTELERRFGISISDSEMSKEDFASVAALVALVDRLKSVNSASSALSEG